MDASGMSKAIECIYENNVLKPVGKIPLKDGERVRITIERQLGFEPIKLKKKPTAENIRSIRDDAWTSS
jgi:predicted DNA-binding antitoxin AbrB/MazE fold protein